MNPGTTNQQINVGRTGVQFLSAVGQITALCTAPTTLQANESGTSVPHNKGTGDLSWV